MDTTPSIPKPRKIPRPKDGGPEKEKRRKHLRVPVTKKEEEQIAAMAKTAGLKIAEYLRNVGIGYRITGVLDHQKIEEMARINGDLGRLGGLLKLWLTNDEKLAEFDKSKVRNVIEGALVRILENQATLRATMQHVLSEKNFSS